MMKYAFLNKGEGSMLNILKNSFVLM